MTLTKPRLSFAALALTAVLGLGACATTGPIASDSYTSTALLNAEAKQSLDARVAAFDRSMNGGDRATIFDYLPPKIVQSLEQQAKSQGADPEVVKAMLSGMLQVVAGELKLAGRHDLSQALVGTTGNGTPYVLVPGAARLSMGGRTATAQGISLALQDGGQWYLFGLSDQDALKTLRAAYPEFRGVPLPVSQR